MFCGGFNCYENHEITHLNRNTINKYFVLLSFMTRILGLKVFVEKGVGMSSRAPKLSSQA
jgi:hypothetical protein